jgi:tetratricopeptide (TPR) repeat protein
MGLRFYKSIRLGKFIRLNISKSGLSATLGRPGMNVNIGRAGARVTAGIPGSGLSYRREFGGRSRRAKSQTDEALETPQPEPLPEPGFFAPRPEKELVKGLNAFLAGRAAEALDHFRAAAPQEASAAILAASLLREQDGDNQEAAALLEEVVQADEEFPTPLMEKYLGSPWQVEIDITPGVAAAVPVTGLAATLLLVEIYQAQGRLAEAIGLLEEVEELAGSPALTLSLCELYAASDFWDGVIERGQQIEARDDVTLAIVIFYGRAMQAKGLHEAAVAVFSDALRRKRRPKDEASADLWREAKYWRAISYQATGKARQANKEWQQLFAQEPGFRDVAGRVRGEEVGGG